jgi:putative flavoprotein involved in K+ transport
MPQEQVETLVIGAGQAGIAMSEHLGAHGLPHLVVEKSRIAESWRTARWDALVANGPAWHDRFPNREYEGIDPDAFPPKEMVADYLAAYAGQISAPVRCGVEVKSLRRDENGGGFQAETPQSVIAAKRVVVATGAFQKPLMPQIVPQDIVPVQIHSHAYRNPGQLTPGAVLVVGAGSSGTQIADELQRAGRKVYLSVGPHNKPPRRYRGKDFVWWLGALGYWAMKTPHPGMEHITIAVSGAYGGKTIDFRKLAHEGMMLVGRVEACRDGVLAIAGDLRQNLQRGDDDYNAVLDQADAYAKAQGLDMPLEPEARAVTPDPGCVINPLSSLDLKKAGITSIIWATGYVPDYSWVKLDAFDEKGRPRHERGVSVVPGLYFLGLPWLSNRSSSFIWGVWNDAKHLADTIFQKT